jgi:RHS repeat-associated protein
VTYSGTGGSVLGKEVSRPWRHETASSTRDWGTITAHFTGTAHAKSWTSLDDGAGSQWRTTEQYNSYDTVAGRLTQTDDRGDTTTASDDRCTRTTYAATTLAALALPARSETVAVRCATTPDRSRDVLTDTRYAYDAKGYGETPTLGDLTRTATLKDHDGTTGTYLESGATYDAYGRLRSSTDLTADVTATHTGTPQRSPRTDGRTSTTVYTPATGYPTTITSTTPPAKAGVSTSAQTTVTTLDTVRRLPVKITDTNNKITNLAYDALGRSQKVWLADRSVSSPPSYQFTYRIAEGQPVAVGTKTIGNRGLQDTAYTIYDGFLRERQTQTPGPDGGRLLTDVFYDERGLAAKSFAPYYTTGAPAQTLFLPTDDSTVETQTRHTFDGLGRETEARLMAGDGDGGEVLSVTKTIHGGDRTTVIPPTGGTATTTLSDARGQLTEQRQHHQRTAGAPFDATTYQYTPRGELAAVTDPAGNQWTYSYDQLGRQTSTTDPDAGTSTSVYDDRGQVTSTTNARDITLAYLYDGLGRQTELREDGPQGELRAQWQYDTLSGAKGQLAKSTRWENGEAYITQAVAYDKLYRLTRSRVTIPASEGPLAGVYQNIQAYNVSGTVQSVGFPAAGNLPGQVMTFDYEDGTLRPLVASGAQGLRVDTTYSLTGKPLQFELGYGAGKKAWATNTYEWGTQRLKTARVDRLDQPGVDRHETYDYDAIGNVLSIADVSRTGTDVQCFSYDYLRRLTDAWTQATEGCATSGTAATVGGPAPYHHSYTYDEVGNRLTETLHEQNTTRTYGYSDTQPHTLTEVVQDAPGVRSLEEYGYDATGNTTSRQLGGDTQTLTWNPEGRVEKVTNADGSTAEYLYDANGTRLIGRTDTETTLYLGHTEITVATGSTTTEATRYFDVGGGHMAVMDNDGNVSFTMADHHGTGQLAIDAATQTITQRRTLPFGATRGEDPATAWPGTRSFVGGTNDTATGLTNVGAREYDPALGRFISLDPIMDLTDPQQIHGYTYANNNPLTFSDPTGLFLKDFLDEAAEVTGKVINTGKQVYRESKNTVGGWISSGKRKANSFLTGAYHRAIDKISELAELFNRVTGNGDRANRLRYQRNNSGSPLPGGNVTSTLKDLAGPARDDAWYRAGEMLTEVTFPWFPGAGMAATAATLAARVGSRTTASVAANTTEAVARTCGRHSFVPGTHVLLASGAKVPIEDVRIGDEVLATDPITGETEARAVTAEILGEGDKNLVAVTTEEATIVATDTHPFWVVDLEEWVEAGNLMPGTFLRTSAGTYIQVTAVVHWSQHATVYNLTVEGLHTYYVLAGSVPVLVHNSNCGLVEYGSTELSRATAFQRLAENNKGNNYGAARLEDGTILVGRSSAGVHAEEDLIRQAGDRRIVDLYSERQPCAAKCEGLTAGMNTSWSWQWNGVDRGAVNAEIKATINNLFK